jgi:lysyl-tRNA synthetase, class II
MIDELISERLKKVARLREAGIDPYPARAKRTATIREALAKFTAFASARKRLALVGRVMTLRDQGGVVFLDLRDETGELQIVLNKKTLPKFDFWKSILDRGDFIAVEGALFKTKKGTESIEAKTLQLLAKGVRPLPSTWFGLEEIETRLRQRYVDLIMHPETAELFRKKSRFWQEMRDFLRKEGYLEVETSTLEHVPGGAEAEPFKTHHNALDTDFYLRISLELPLKRLLVGGFEKVFEIGRVFRNEGIDHEHLQDYTELEFYAAYGDYNDLMRLTERMYKTVIKNTFGTLTVMSGDTKINWGKKWPRVDYVAVFKKANGIDPLAATRDELFKKAVALGLKPEPNLGRGRLIDLIYKKTVRSNLVQPCFLVDPPVDIEPLAKRSSKDPRRVERMQIVACGTELGKGFSELNDPADQRGRFEEQMKLRAAGDTEAQMLEEDFIEALEYGMPPAMGFGVSERLFAVLADRPVRETVFFPLMRPEGK